jgi:hypothetical protein
VQFNDVPVGGWCKEQVGASDDEKKFLMGRVTADRNTVADRGSGVVQFNDMPVTYAGRR